MHDEMVRYITEKSTKQIWQTGMDTWLEFDRLLAQTDFSKVEDRNNLRKAFYRACAYVNENLCNKLLQIARHSCEVCEFRRFCHGGIQQRISELIEAIDNEPTSRLEERRKEITMLTQERMVVVNRILARY